MLNSIRPCTLLMSWMPSPSSSSFTTSRKWRCRRSTSEITSRYSFPFDITASRQDTERKVKANFVKFPLSFRAICMVQELHDPGEIEPAGAAIDIELVEVGCGRAHRRRRPGRAGRLLRQTQILQHIGGGEAGPVPAVGGRRRHRPRHRAIAGHRPALAG